MPIANPSPQVLLTEWEGTVSKMKTEADFFSTIDSTDAHVILTRNILSPLGLTQTAIPIADRIECFEKTQSTISEAFASLESETARLN